jgi:hypothetical protein
VKLAVMAGDGRKARCRAAVRAVASRMGQRRGRGVRAETAWQGEARGEVRLERGAARHGAGWQCKVTSWAGAAACRGRRLCAGQRRV